MLKEIFKFCLFVFFLGLSACGDNQPFVSAFERRVATSIDSNEETQNNDAFREPASQTQEIVEEAEEIETVEDNVEPTITLFEKVLQNSDVSEVALTNAFEFYDANHQIIENQDWITIFDIGQHSGNRRMYVINMNTGDVRAIHTAHGKKSDLDHDGVATQFSNANGSNKSSLGFMLTAETYSGKHGYSLRLDGLEARNSNVRTRAIVIHGASYVDPSWNKMGRSLGCPAVSWANRDWYINAVKEGSLFYTFHEDYD